MTIQFSLSNHIATLAFNRPDAANAMDPETRVLFRQLCERIRTDDGIRVVIVTGTGEKAFCAGADLKKTLPGSESFAQQVFGRPESGAMSAGLDTIDKPLIAAVNGYAMGGGMEIALACDIRLAAENASFALSEVKVGSMPGSGGSQRLPRVMALSDAMLMLLTGDSIGAAEALRMGLVSKVVPQDRLMPLALEIAQRIAANAPLSVRAVKRVVRQGLDMPLSHGLDVERYAFGLLYGTEDRMEGRRAFVEKRKPVFKGR